MSTVRTGGIALRGVTRRFGEQTVLDGLDLTLPAGTTTALMGPNASGKTTAARLLLGLDAPDLGVVDGLDGLRCAAVFQEHRLCGHLSAVENLRLVLPHADWHRVDDELSRVGLVGEAQTKPVRELSGGQRRRVAIARAMIVDADFIVLDEPFTGLDVDVKPLVLSYVKERVFGRTALLITHDRAEARALGATIARLPGR
ncbi:MAG TPA: ATP-binding cassette domain-containing protein [Demequinaceae bacterium]